MLGEGAREGGALGGPAHEGGQWCGQCRDGRKSRVERRGVRPVAGELGQGATVGHPELAQQRRDVALDGANREVQPGGDLLVGQVLADQGEHLGLTLGDAGVGE